MHAVAEEGTLLVVATCPACSVPGKVLQGGALACTMISGRNPGWPAAMHAIQSAKAGTLVPMARCRAQSTPGKVLARPCLGKHSYQVHDVGQGGQPHTCNAGTLAPVPDACTMHTGQSVGM